MQLLAVAVLAEGALGQRAADGWAPNFSVGEGCEGVTCATIPSLVKLANSHSQN
jgi:hypothetical protein